MKKNNPKLRQKRKNYRKGRKIQSQELLEFDSNAIGLNESSTINIKYIICWQCKKIKDNLRVSLDNLFVAGRLCLSAIPHAQNIKKINQY
jgi:hypothetical protein